LITNRKCASLRYLAKDFTPTVKYNYRLHLRVSEGFEFSNDMMRPALFYSVNVCRYYWGHAADWYVVRM